MIDPSRITFHLLPLPKGAKGTRAATFLGHEPAGTFTTSRNKTYLCTANAIIELAVPGKPAAIGPEAVFAGTSWVGKNRLPAATAWTIRGNEAIGSALLSPGFHQSHANAANGAHVAGTGEPKGEAPSRALLWTDGTKPPVVLMNPHDPDAGTLANAVWGDVQGGAAGGALNASACIWRGNSESIVLLHPQGTDLDTSCVRSVCATQQVGDFERHMKPGVPKGAALWRGSAESFVDLTPEGVINAAATTCVDGFQAGWAEAPRLPEAPRWQRHRAWLWAGSAAESFNLHSVVGDDWTSSNVYRSHVHEGRLLLLGTVEKHQQIGALITLVAEQACWWEYALPGV